jgi:hypothetical protein
VISQTFEKSFPFWRGRERKAPATCTLPIIGWGHLQGSRPRGAQLCSILVLSNFLELESSLIPSSLSHASPQEHTQPPTLASPLRSDSTGKLQPCKALATTSSSGEPCGGRKRKGLELPRWRRGRGGRVMKGTFSFLAGRLRCQM